MSPIEQIIINKKTDINSIWIMRQAGRYLPEFREIRKKNTDFIKLCLDYNLSSEITLQPLKRFELDAAIIFSDILMLPYGLDQKVEFKKNLGPILGDLDLNKISKIEDIRMLTSDSYKYVVENKKEDIKFSDLELIFKDLKSLFEKRGFIINWKALEKQSLDETINALAMASPFTIEEKQVLLEAKSLNIRKTKISEILTTYSFDQYNNTTVQ